MLCVRAFVHTGTAHNGQDHRAAAGEWGQGLASWLVLLVASPLDTAAAAMSLNCRCLRLHVRRWLVVFLYACRGETVQQRCLTS